MAREKAQLPLLVTQQNQVFRLVEGAGFDPRDFEWGVIESPRGVTVDRLVHTASDYFIAFDVIPLDQWSMGLTEDRVVYFSPGPNAGGRNVATVFGWDGQLEVVEVWLATLRAEVSTVSLWDTLGSGAARELATADLSNGKLSREQQEQVAIRIQQVRLYLRANVDDPEALARVEKKLDYLVDASKRLGIKDYASVALGTLLGIGLDVAMDPHRAQEMINLFMHGMRALLGG